MIPLGLSATEQAAFHRALLASHEIDVRVDLLDLEERHLGRLTGRLLGGQVVGDADAEVTRSCQITLLDPLGRVDVGDPDRPEQVARFDRMISVSYGVWVDELDRWVRVPVFRGPVVKAPRKGPIVEIEALGKEHLLRNDGGIVHDYKANERRTDVIQNIARRMGERRMVIPSWTPRTSKRSVIPKLGFRSDPWPWIIKLAQSMRAQVWYDGLGTLRLRRIPVRPLWWFNERQLVTDPEVTAGDQGLINTVWVKGQPPEGKKWLVEAHGSLPAWHANSPQRLGRNGANRYLTEEISDDSIRTVYDAETAVARRLREVATQSFTVAFDCLPVPHLDVGDPAHLTSAAVTGNFRISTFTLPLTGEAMSIGYVRETRPRGIRTRHTRPKPKGAKKR